MVMPFMCAHLILSSKRFLSAIFSFMRILQLFCQFKQWRLHFSKCLPATSGHLRLLLECAVLLCERISDLFACGYPLGLTKAPRSSLMYLFRGRWRKRVFEGKGWLFFSFFFEGIAEMALLWNSFGIYYSTASSRLKLQGSKLQCSLEARRWSPSSSSGLFQTTCLSFFSDLPTEGKARRTDKGLESSV